MSLQSAYEKLLSFPNGRQVVRCILQLTDFGLQPENEYLYHSTQRVIDAIDEREEQFLERSQLDIVRDGRAIKPFHDALRQSTEEEWEQFKSEVDIPPFEQEGIDRLLADASGLVRGTRFEDWVLGKENKLPVDHETLDGKMSLLSKEKGE